MHLGWRLQKRASAPPLDSAAGFDKNVFGVFRVEYSSSPTAAGGRFRNAFFRQVFRTTGLWQVTMEKYVSNIVDFRLFGLVDGQIALVGILSPGKDGRRYAHCIHSSRMSTNTGR